MKKVIFFVDSAESDVYEFSDDVTTDELQDAADEWVANNIGGAWDILDYDEN